MQRHITNRAVFPQLIQHHGLSCVSAAHSTSRSELRFRSSFNETNRAAFLQLIPHHGLSCVSAAHSTSRTELRFCSLFHIKIRAAFPQLIPHHDKYQWLIPHYPDRCISVVSRGSRLIKIPRINTESSIYLIGL